MSQARPVTAPHPVDVHVGRRLRERRLRTGKSQEQIADGLGVSLAQYRRYENGTNRMAASRLHDVARLVGVTVTYLFDGMPASIALRPPANTRSRRAAYTASGGLVPAGEKRQDEQLTADLVDAYHRIETRSVRRKLLELMQRLGDMCAELEALERADRQGKRSVKPPSADCG